MTPSETSIPSGFCQCGCGQKTSIAKQTKREFGHIAGRPVFYRQGHKPYAKPRLIRQPIEQPDDPSIRHIPLSKGMFTIVDAADFEWLNQWNWWVPHPDNAGYRYAKRYWNGRGAKAKRWTVWMHRAILGLEKGDKRVIDHINHNGLDNRRCNLRIATHSQNHANTRINKRNSSGIKGVFFDKRRGNWMARIAAAYPTPELAKEAYERMAVAAFGEFANFG